jgi:hypothetical protein
MTDQKTTSSTRRHWLTTSVRWGLLAGIAATWTRVSRSQSGVTEQACIDLKGLTGCRKCGQFSACGLPRALSVKHFLESQPNEQSDS